jgi:hypothetical protein
MKLTTALIVIIALWVLLPTDPITDCLITLPIIASIGWNNYFNVCIVMLVVGYFVIDGNTLKDKWNTIKREIRKVV